MSDIVVYDNLGREVKKDRKRHVVNDTQYNNIHSDLSDIKDAMIKGFKEKGRILNRGELSMYTGIPIRRINALLDSSDVLNRYVQDFKANAQVLANDVIMRMYLDIMDGNATPAKIRLFLEYAVNFIPPVDQEKINRLPTSQDNYFNFQNGGNITIVSAIPGKLDGET